MSPSPSSNDHLSVRATSCMSLMCAACGWKYRCVLATTSLPTREEDVDGRSCSVQRDNDSLTTDDNNQDLHEIQSTAACLPARLCRLEVHEGGGTLSTAVG